MKTTKQLLLIALVCSTFSLFAQQKVALHSNGVTTIFGGANPFLDAYNAASTGDTLYLPGGNLPYPATIDKGLVIIGVGHYPDATVATAKTLLYGNLTISQNADNLHLEGIELSGSITFSSNHKVDFVNIKRCKFVSLTYAGNRTKACENNVISECVIMGSIDLANAKSSLISNCIINGQISNGLEMGISNNLLFYSAGNSYYGYITFNNIDNSLISNNIVFRIYPELVHGGCELSTFQNNIFAIVPASGSVTFTDNYNSINLSALFVNQSGIVFDYSHDYHLVNPTTYPGTDGTQVGIYGGMYPYKAASVPVNPQFQMKTIATQTDNNGDLNIQIQVEAQDN